MLPDFPRAGCTRGNLGHRVHEFLRRTILTGVAGPGTTLPSTRALAKRWKLSRNTVMTAYEELALEGLVSARAGSGTVVRSMPQRMRLPDLRMILRASGYPADARWFGDSEGNPVYFHR